MIDMRNRLRLADPRDRAGDRLACHHGHVHRGEQFLHALAQIDISGGGDLRLADLAAGAPWCDRRCR